MKNFFQYANPRFDKANIDDCYIRALAIALKMNYDEVESIFYKKQIELQSDLPNRPWVIKAILQDMGYKYTETINPLTGTGAMKIYSFLKENKGMYILESKGHLCYAENGKVFDTWDSSNKLLKGYWIIN